MRMTRWMYGTNIMDRFPCSELRDKLGTDDIITVVQQHRLTVWECLTVRLCIQETLNVCSWGDKVPPYSVSNILDNWYWIVSSITRCCTAIQAESNKLFFVITKCVFVEIFRKFQRHCFYSFP